MDGGIRRLIGSRCRLSVVRLGKGGSQLGTAGGDLFLKAEELGERFVEGAVVGGSIAKKDAEAFLVYAGFGKAGFLEAESALGEPPGMSHLLDKRGFGGGGRAAVFEKHAEEGLEFGGIFAGDDPLTGGEAMFERITRRSQFAGRGARAGIAGHDMVFSIISGKATQLPG